MSELDAVSALLPVWARVPGVPFVPVAFAIGAFVTAAASRAALPRVRGLAQAHWTERARASHPARWVGGAASLSVAMSIATLAALRAGPLAPVPAWGLALAAGLAAYAGGMLVVARLERRVGLAHGSPFVFALQRLAMLAVLFPQIAVLVALLVSVGAPFDARDLVAGCGGIALYALLSITGGLPLAAACGALRPASPRLAAAVARAAARTGVAPRAVCEIALPIANAFALPLAGALVFTRRCVDALGDAELEAIACHELGHLGEPRRVQVVRVLGSLALLPLGFSTALIGVLGVPLGLGCAYVAMLAIAIPAGRTSRRMEERADRVAHAHAEDPIAYARALERLHECGLVPAVGWTNGGTHPHLYDRMTAAGSAPDYPRPAPPSRLRALAGALAGIAALAASALPLSDPAGAPFGTREQRALLAVALFGGSQRDFFELALPRADLRPAEAVSLLEAALALEPDDHSARALLARALVARGRCDAARAALDASVAVLRENGSGHASGCPWIADAAARVERCAPPALAGATAAAARRGP
ncbi:MAG: hypothetical protein DCC71_09355 [Proteobacteria bacterium]|nr:MAG: hypothetical protein DCC71_09355 [Pseudomonadota bacterium]